jgi:16S rRNA (uracil1498-N3)-methyltransferase
MPDFRVHCPAAAASSTQLALSPDESHHLIVVNRARLGDPVVAFDGAGREWLTVVASDRKNAAVLRVVSTRAHAPLPFHLTLAQVLPKGPAMDAVVRQATEIGAAAILPLAGDRSQVHFEGDRSDRKVDKWHVAALEAAKQCGNPFVPAIAPVQPAAAFIAATSVPDSADDRAFDLKLIASLPKGARPLRAVLDDFRAAHGRSPRRVLWLIGPEGDFSPVEHALAHTHGFLPVTLGPLVLRCDTAAAYALAITSYELSHAPASAEPAA